MSEPEDQERLSPAGVRMAENERAYWKECEEELSYSRRENNAPVMPPFGWAQLTRQKAEKIWQEVLDAS